MIFETARFSILPTFRQLWESTSTLIVFEFRIEIPHPQSSSFIYQATKIDVAFCLELKHFKILLPPKICLTKPMWSQAVKEYLIQDIRKFFPSLTENPAKHDKQQHSANTASKMIVMVRFCISREDLYQPSCYILTHHSTGHLLPLLPPRYHTLQQRTSPSLRPLGFHLHHPKQSHCKLHKNALWSTVAKETFKASHSPAT